MSTATDSARDVRAVLEEFAAAYGRQDAGACVGLFSEDAVVFGTGADEVRVGQREIREQIRRDFAQADRLALHFGEAHVSLAGNVAWATISDATVEASVAGEDQRLPVRITAVLTTSAERWQISHAHISTPTGAQDPEQSFPPAPHHEP